MSLSTLLTLKVSALQENARDLVTGRADLAKKYTVTLPTGTGAGQADHAFSDQYSIAASGTQIVDLSAIANGVGQSIKFTNVKAIIVSQTGGSSIKVAPNATEGFADWIGGTTPSVEIGDGGVMVVSEPAAGWGITDNVDDKLLITNNDGSNTAVVDVIVIGVATVV